MGRLRFSRIRRPASVRRAARRISSQALSYTRRRVLNPKISDSRQRGPYLRAYVFQVGLAAVALMLTLLAAELLPRLDVAEAVLISAMASTAFVLFIYPHSTHADPRHVIGGHAVAVAVASPLAAFAHAVAGGGFLEGAPLLFGFYAATAVGVAILLMALIGMEHPPAAGTALAFVVHGFAWDWMGFVVVGVLLMSGAHRLLRDRIHDL